jgi:hypothetical protein
MDDASTNQFSREWAISRQVKPGDRLFTDDGFTCMPAWQAKIVRRDEKGELYVACLCERGGRHYLDGQLDEQGRLVGLYRRLPRWARERTATGSEIDGDTGEEGATI